LRPKKDEQQLGGCAVLDLDRLSANVTVLGWTSELPPAGPSDPLGLTLRVGARLGAELLHCITSITPRARYYSLFPWAFRRAANQGEKGTDNVLRHVVLDERALVLGSILHHSGQSCHGGGLGGTLKAQTIAADTGATSIDLRSWQHLETATGGFAAYKGSLINLGLFQQHHDASEESADEEVSVALDSADLSELGTELAEAFDTAVLTTRYHNINPKQGSVERSVLQEFGAAAGFCELRSADHADLLPLRNLFFAAGVEGSENSHYRRRMTLLLMMQAIETADENGLMLDAAAFDDFTFYGRFSTEDGPTKKVNFPPQLQDIQNRWRMFHFHTYLTVALESSLAGIVRAVRSNPAGLTVDEVLNVFDESAIVQLLAEMFETAETGSFFDLTPAESIGMLGLDVFPLLDGNSEALQQFESGSMLERTLRNLLVLDHVAHAAEGPATAVLLLYALLLRHETTVPERYVGWIRAKIDNSYSDIAIPQITDAFESYFGPEWWLTPNRQIVSRLLWRFVITQHQAMSYERGFGGSSPLFYVDGRTVVGTDLGYEEIGSLNARFPSALQILEDLAFVEKSPERVSLTEAGRDHLRSYFKVHP
jgi:hypothetical protein